MHHDCCHDRHTNQCTGGVQFRFMKSKFILKLLNKKQTTNRIKYIFRYSVSEDTGKGYITNNTILLSDFNAHSLLRDNGCDSDDTKPLQLIEFTGDNSVLSLNDGSPTNLSYVLTFASFWAVDLTLTSYLVTNNCKWKTVKEIGSDHKLIHTRVTWQWKKSPGYT